MLQMCYVNLCFKKLEFVNLLFHFDGLDNMTIPMIILKINRRRGLFRQILRAFNDSQ